MSQLMFMDIDHQPPFLPQASRPLHKVLPEIYSVIFHLDVCGFAGCSSARFSVVHNSLSSCSGCMLFSFHLYIWPHIYVCIERDIVTFNT